MGDLPHGKSQGTSSSPPRDFAMGPPWCWLWLRAGAVGAGARHRALVCPHVSAVTDGHEQPSPATKVVTTVLITAELESKHVAAAGLARPPARGPPVAAPSLPQEHGPISPGCTHPPQGLPHSPRDHPTYVFSSPRVSPISPFSPRAPGNFTLYLLGYLLRSQGLPPSPQGSSPDPGGFTTYP